MPHPFDSGYLSYSSVRLGSACPGLGNGRSVGSLADLAASARDLRSRDRGGDRQVFARHDPLDRATAFHAVVGHGSVMLGQSSGLESSAVHADSGRMICSLTLLRSDSLFLSCGSAK
jgi:hypothetical protein